MPVKAKKQFALTHFATRPFIIQKNSNKKSPGFQLRLKIKGSESGKAYSISELQANRYK
jgi:hypothetical protein